MKQFQILDNWMHHTMGPVFKFQDQINKTIQPLISSQISLQSALKPLFDFTVNLNIPKYTFPDFKPLEIQTINPLRTAFNSISEELQINLKGLPPKIQEALILLAKHGWFLDLKMSVPFLLELKKGIEKDNLQDSENTLIRFFDDRLDQIESAIIKRCPDREKIINAAISAHRREEYVLSIPVMLAQADGICKEVTSEYFFMKRRNDKKPRTATYVQDVTADTFRAAFLSPLSENLPICMSEKERDTEFNELNRHMVLHGESIDYGTKINSLKAISFVNYVAQMLKPDCDP
ncbi:MAG: hypothetical protein HGA81_10620 [Chlorobium limicola]|nr:hypothetical protein [Chlorobium limicola]